MEHNYSEFQKNIRKQNRNLSDGGMVLDFMDAMEVIQSELKVKLGEDMEIHLGEEKENVKKDKKYLRASQAKFREFITDIVYSKSMRIRGYENERINAFIEEMVEEFDGYSILSDAFYEPSVSDIFCIDWQTIFVEKDGVNMEYWRKFRSPSHYFSVVDRFVRKAGTEINMGDKKIVDFELYQDRGCATSPAVSPRDYSLTLRKHAEDHITKEQLIEWNVLTDKMSEFLGTIIMGECNLIYAGITGSGKTTSIRALLDHYVTLSNKRMLVTEDTQELFPKNKHTLELVSVKHNDKDQAVPLGQLIYTALRLKPKYIVVGEVRGVEALEAVEGAETGHSTIFTMHGGTAWNIMNRLVTKYMMAMPALGIDVVERIIGSAIDYVCIQDNIPGIGRKITSITEVSYDFNTRRMILKTICRFDFRTKDFVWEGTIDEEKADKMMRRGVPYEDIQKWMVPQVA